MNLLNEVFENSDSEGSYDDEISERQGKRFKLASSHAANPTKRLRKNVDSDKQVSVKDEGDSQHGG